MSRVVEFNDGLRAFLRSQYSEIGETIRSTKELNDDTAAQLQEAIRAYKADFVGSEEPAVEVPGAEPVAVEA